MAEKTILSICGCILAALCSGLPASAAEDPGRTVAGPVAAAVTKVRDGDTVEVEAFIWPQQVVRTAVRLRGIDAPELKGRCAGEHAAAAAARGRLEALVGGQNVELREITGDKYFGRVLARLASDDVPDVAQQLMNEGLVAPYRGDKRRDWCAGAASVTVPSANARRG